MPYSTIPQGQERKPHLTQEEMAELSHVIAAARDGSEEDVVLQEAAADARKQFIEGNLGLVRVIAGELERRPRDSTDKEDLFQMGIFGLNKAITGFDPGRGFRFSTFARREIAKSISRALDNTDRAIRIPAEQAERMRADHRRDGEYASREDRMIQKRSHVLSAETLTGADERPHDPVYYEAKLDDEVVTVRKILKGAGLNGKEQAVIVLGFGFNNGFELSNAELAEKMGLGVGDIDNLQASALQKMRDYAEEQQIDASALYS